MTRLLLRIHDYLTAHRLLAIASLLPASPDTNDQVFLDALNKMQQDSNEYREQIPSREQLKARSYELQRETIRKTLREAWS